MNKEQATGNWNIFKGKVKEQWGKLTDDDFTALEGDRDQLVGHVQKRYGIAKEESVHQVSDFQKQNADIFRN